MTADEVAVPQAFTFAWPTLQAVKELGGSATIDEMPRKVAEIVGLSEEQQALPHVRGSRSKFEYRLAWARTALKNIGALVNSARGVWSVTEAGREMTREEVDQKVRVWRTSLIGARVPEPGDGLPEAEPGPEDDEDAWRTQLLEVLRSMDPIAFERLFVRVLREAGFVNVETTRVSGDEGIDGTGIYNLSLVSFPVYFQCKRWKNSVGSQEIRNFRGAMVGRADHALFVTTSTFTPAAQTEASRPGPPPIDLIDGERLCELLRQYNLGVTSVPRTIYDVELHPEFFANV